MAIENIHIAKFEPGLLNTVQQKLAVDLRALMCGDVHYNNGLFTLRFRGCFFNRFRLWLLYRGWRRLWLRDLRFWRSRLWRSNRLRLRRGGLHRLRCGNRLRLRMRLWLRNRLWLRMRRLDRRLLHARLLRLRCGWPGWLLVAHRLLHLTLIRGLVLVRRRLMRCVMLPCYARGVIDLVDTNFAHAFITIIKAIIRLVVFTRLHAF